MKPYISPWIYTTMSCPLNCGYCYVKQTKEEMVEEVYQKLFDVLQQCVDNSISENVILRIGGGEPLLVFNKWKNHVKNFRLKNLGRVGVSVLTSLYRDITNEEMDFFKSDCGVSTSLDGWNTSKPFKNGKSSSKFVINNLLRLYDEGINQVHISTVVTPAILEDFDIMAKFIGQKKFNWGIYFDHYYIEDGKQIEYIKAIKRAIDILYDEGYDLLNYFKINNISFKGSYNGCTAGNKLFAIDTKGGVFPCQTAYLKKELFSIFDEESYLKFNNVYNTGEYECLNEEILPDVCKNCLIFDYCHGSCKLNQHAIGNNETCYVNKEIFLYVIKKILKEKENAKL